MNAPYGSQMESPKDKLLYVIPEVIQPIYPRSKPSPSPEYPTPPGTPEYASIADIHNTPTPGPSQNEIRKERGTKQLVAYQN